MFAVSYEICSCCVVAPDSCLPNPAQCQPGAKICLLYSHSLCSQAYTSLPYDRNSGILYYHLSGPVFIAKVFFFFLQIVHYLTPPPLLKFFSDGIGYFILMAPTMQNGCTCRYHLGEN